MSSGLLQVFVELRNLHGTSNYVLYCSDSVCHNRVQVLSIPVYYNKDEDNSPKNLNDKNQQASSQKFRQLTYIYIYIYIYVRGVMVTVVGNGHDNPSSNPGQRLFALHIALIL